MVLKFWPVGFTCHGIAHEYLKISKSISTSITDKQNGVSTVGENLLAEKINFKVAAGTG